MILYGSARVLLNLKKKQSFSFQKWGSLGCRGRGRDRMVVGFTTIYAIGAYHH
jgi:hypothetical protein